MAEASLRSETSLKSGLRPDAVATRAWIVAAAERLFADIGIDATSLAEINKAAGQRNRSAVQYHFGDKEGVFTPSSISTLLQSSCTDTRCSTIPMVDAPSCD